MEDTYPYLAEAESHFMGVKPVMVIFAQLGFGARTQTLDIPLKPSSYKYNSFVPISQLYSTMDPETAI
jgi:hypothetical protein